MEKEFPLLLSQENKKNMRIIKENKKVVSVVNFLPRKIIIEGTPISVGSIGAVCTHVDYRERGYSSKILKDVEKRMKKIGVNLCLISGTRNLYRKWGADKVKNCKRYRIFAGLLELKYTIREYKKEDLLSLKEIYDLQKTRYLRNIVDFETLIDSGTFPFGDTSYKRYVLEDEKNLRGYIILKETSGKIEVKEAGGKEKDIFDALAFLGTMLEVNEIDYILPQEKKVPKGYLGEEEYLGGTLKIIDFVSFIDELRPYFKQYVTDEEVDSFKVEEIEGRYRLIFESEEIEIESHNKLLKLIFEKKEEKIYKETNMNNKKLEKFIDSVFPLPFLWTENLNYQ